MITRAQQSIEVRQASSQEKAVQYGQFTIVGDTPLPKTLTRSGGCVVPLVMTVDQLEEEIGPSALDHAEVLII
jgi:hypothetical protein